MFCPNCGTRINDDARFCPMCKFPLEDSSQVNTAHEGNMGSEYAPSIPVSPAYNANPPYGTGYGTGDGSFRERQYITSEAKKKKTGIIIAVAAGVIVLILAAVLAVTKGFFNDIMPEPQGDARTEDTISSGTAETVDMEAYKSKARTAIDVYLQSLKYLSDNQFSDMGAALEKLKESLAGRSRLKGFWEENAVYLTGYRGTSIVDRVELADIDYVGKITANSMEAESEEKWVLSGKEYIFNFTYTLSKNSYGNWVIEDVICDELLEYLESAGNASAPAADPDEDKHSGVGAAIYNTWDSVTSSSILEPDNQDDYLPQHVLDENSSTAWAEGADGDGIGEWIMLQSNTPQTVRIIDISNGFRKSQDLYFKNNRVKKVKIEFSDGQYVVQELDDGYSLVNHVMFDDPVTTNIVKITILEVYKGSKYSDTCISDISTCR